ncbi:MAG: YggT family protein [Gammaproteobacteria bacterium]|nr:YggT family protein [Gammaproteobacteria bacterium]
MNPATDALLYAVNAIFFLLITLMLLRVWMQAARVNYYDQLVQFVVRITEPVVAPLRRVIPDLGKLNTAALVWAWLLGVIELMIILSLAGGGFDPISVSFFSLTGLVESMISLAIWVVIGQAILSWVSPQGNPIYNTLSQMTYPLMRPISRLIPPIGGFDISPIFLIIALNMLRIVVSGFTVL